MSILVTLHGDKCEGYCCLSFFLRRGRKVESSDKNGTYQESFFKGEKIEIFISTIWKWKNIVSKTAKKFALIANKFEVGLTSTKAFFRRTVAPRPSVIRMKSTHWWRRNITSNSWNYVRKVTVYKIVVWSPWTSNFEGSLPLDRVQNFWSLVWPNFQGKRALVRKNTHKSKKDPAYLRLLIRKFYAKLLRERKQGNYKLYDLHNMGNASFPLDMGENKSYHSTDTEKV